MSIQIGGISESDSQLLAVAQLKESIKPSRCPQCKAASVQEIRCSGGSLCGYACGGGGFRIYCENCNATINGAECEEAEES